jgi:type I restriction-modification system DNA methylase subunit
VACLILLDSSILILPLTEAHWTYLQRRVKDPLIGKLLDNAMVAIDCDNSSLKGCLPKNYARLDLNKQYVGAAIDLIAKIGLGDKESRSKSILGRVFSDSCQRWSMSRKRHTVFLSRFGQGLIARRVSDSGANQTSLGVG